MNEKASRLAPMKETEQNSMKSPLLVSVVFHVFLMLLFSGFFFFSKPIEVPETPVAVELLPVAEMAQSKVDAPVAEPKPVKEPVEVPDEPPPMAKSTEAKPTEKPAEPKPKPKAEDKKKEEKKVEEKKEEPVKEEKKSELAKEKKPPKPPRLPERKEEEKKEPEPKEEPQEDAEQFSSVLKNLVGAEDTPPDPKAIPRDTPRQEPQLTAPAPLGAALSMSEMDALRSQLAQCWNIMPGAREADDLVVEIQVSISPDRVLTQANVVDQLRYSSDSFFRAAADAALRALRSPACTPLNLPEDKYDQWKSMTIQFDPKNMF